MKRGVSALREAQKVDEQKQKEAERRKSGLGYLRRFWVPANEFREIIILNRSVEEEAVAIYEHNLQINGKWGNHEMCLKEFAACPFCQNHGDSYYVMFLTCLNVSGYTKTGRNGQPDEFVPHTREILAIKHSQIGKFLELEQAAKAQGKSMRGMYLRMKRPSDGQSSNIGEPALITETGSLFHIYSEEELVQDYGHPAVKGRDGKTIIKTANADITPIDFTKVLEKPDIQAIYRNYGFTPPAGSDLEAQQAWEDAGDGEQEQVAVAPSGPRKRFGTAAAPAPAEQEEDDLDYSQQGEDEGDDEGQYAEEEGVEEQEEEQEEEAPPAAPVRPISRNRAPAATRPPARQRHRAPANNDPFDA